MPEPIRWDIEEHTRAKHRVLRSYLDQWIPIMGRTALRHTSGEKPRLLLADGFAGPGRYVEGESGSPLIMLDALLSHRDFPNLGGVDFHFLFIEHDARRYDALVEEFAAMDDMPANVNVQLVPGRFEEEFGSLVDAITEEGKILIPTFAFIDPFGYSHASMSLTGKFLDFPRTEALFLLPLSFIARFVGRDRQETALNGLFGSERWREAIPLEGAERSEFLLDLFEEQLYSQGRVEPVLRPNARERRPGLPTAVRNGSSQGTRRHEDGQWKVDPVSGTTYEARMETGRQVLFNPTADTSPTPGRAEVHLRRSMVHDRGGSAGDPRDAGLPLKVASQTEDAGASRARREARG